MTVEQLIDLLKALPQDLPVYLGDWNEGYAPDVPIDYADASSSLLPREVPAEEEIRRYTCTGLPRRVVIG
jgi:hypothetical protein